MKKILLLSIFILFSSKVIANDLSNEQAYLVEGNEKIVCSTSMSFCRHAVQWFVTGTKVRIYCNENWCGKVSSIPDKNDLTYELKYYDDKLYSLTLKPDKKKSLIYEKSFVDSALIGPVDKQYWMLTSHLFYWSLHDQSENLDTYSSQQSENLAHIILGHVTDPDLVWGYDCTVKNNSLVDFGACDRTSLSNSRYQKYYIYRFDIDKIFNLNMHLHDARRNKMNNIEFLVSDGSVRGPFIKALKTFKRSPEWQKKGRRMILQNEQNQRIALFNIPRKLNMLASLKGEENGYLVLSSAKDYLNAFNENHRTHAVVWKNNCELENVPEGTSIATLKRGGCIYVLSKFYDDYLPTAQEQELLQREHDRLLSCKGCRLD